MNFETKKRPYILIVILIVSIFLIIICIPFVIEWILLNKTTFPFNMSINFTEEVWFGFIASYIGALGTIALGIIALWQNKRYKELSEKSSHDAALIQKDLKSLSLETMEAIEILKRIELAKYYPLIERIPYTSYGTTKAVIESLIESEDDVIQINYLNVDMTDLTEPISELVEKYNSYYFIVRNISEKTIRNFTCTEVTINGIGPSFRVSSNCDIPPGKNAIILISDFPRFLEGEVIELEMKFTLNNLVMERYYIETHTIISFDNEGPSSYFAKFTSPVILE
ncbi:hypothetical protein [Serpentinicella alkaliphila]|nr:hypothetical protein [Serpentinicella alkaliphila]QUH25546.1 hypothetical protein HZR23_07215 [Serpentinicella alkaliphila]